MPHDSSPSDPSPRPSATDPGLAGLAGLDDHRLAERLATLAGARLVDLRTTAVAESWETSDLKDAGDRAAHVLLTGLLARLRPGDAVLSEEGADDPARLDADRVWIVDPLDGTREFGEPPRDDWAVHVALWERGAGAPGEVGDLTAGAVAQAALGETWSTADVPVPPPYAAGAPRLVVSRSRPPEVSDVVAAAIGATLVPMGSAGAKVMAVVRGVADVYVHAGGQYEWDSAAPVAVARAAGLHTSRIDGSPLRYNAADVYLPDLVVCRAELADAVLAAIAAG
ncbi:3'(2'),5'-bisphosphate nucleotidase CysQ [Nocardioides zeae]|uniref:3'(2'), 5'-bisphosphate nucleotidase n=1 Tax=Nocardioides zeae TaxID=1457234 RepID=A0AAJ1X1V7_9ACTN|nr:3'(2'),5'-bisphosphate nucleotidase CysQ [Nocardioides zeae]MDQ1104569.1 3'(2'), 5'-bisphosphate nucleotidase [Nocardioides zeae]